jgi:hypothetical protein
MKSTLVEWPLFQKWQDQGSSNAECPSIPYSSWACHWLPRYTTADQLDTSGLSAIQKCIIQASRSSCLKNRLVTFGLPDFKSQPDTLCRSDPLIDSPSRFRCDMSQLTWALQAKRPRHSVDTIVRTRADAHGFMGGGVQLAGPPRKTCWHQPSRRRQYL